MFKDLLKPVTELFEDETSQKLVIAIEIAKSIAHLEDYVSDDIVNFSWEVAEGLVNKAKEDAQ